MRVKSTIIISFLSVFGLALPTFCLAQGGVIFGAFLSVFAVIYGLIFNILGTITGAFLGAAVALFNWVSSDTFISLSYTNAGLSLGDPHFNPFIEIGWTLTRDLTNIFFVLALVVIGLATALRINDYQAKKALPVLIIIALLINFTPVILGLIVDAANIVMNFFAQGGFSGGNNFANYATRQWGNMSTLFGLGEAWDPLAKVGAAVGSGFLVFFNLIAALIYLLFALLFVVRYVAIWTLTILSPFAFACYIFPATRKIFSMWWQQFIQWSLVGAIAAFFLYLGDHFIRAATDPNNPIMAGSMSEIADAQGLAPIINQTLPYFIALVFLFIGLFASLTFAPKGADAIIKGGQKGINKASTIAGKKYWAGAKGVARIPKGVASGASTYAKTRSFKAAAGATWKGVAHPSPGILQRTWKRAKEHMPADVKAAGRGLQKASREVWGAAIGKKPKTWNCTKCGTTDIPISQAICPNCGSKRGTKETPPSSPSPPSLPSSPLRPSGTPPPPGYVEGGPGGMVLPSSPSRIRPSTPPRLSLAELERSYDDTRIKLEGARNELKAGIRGLRRGSPEYKAVRKQNETIVKQLQKRLKNLNTDLKKARKLES